MQYIGKAETLFNLRLHNQRKDTKKPNSIVACKKFQEKGHNFNKHAKLIIIDKLVNLHGSNIFDVMYFLSNSPEEGQEQN